MKLRDLILLVVALCLLSAVLGVFLLLYLDARQSTSAVETPVGAIPESRTTPRVQEPDADGANAATLPSLVTPTSTALATSTLLPPPTPSPTPTSTSTPTPTATPAPGERLANALLAKRNGDYELAISELRLLLEPVSVVGGMGVAEWLYELAICEYLDHQYEASRVSLDMFLAQHPTDHRVTAAHYYLAETLAALGDYSAAIEHYHAYLDRQEVLADVVYTRIGDNHIALGDYPSAIEAYRQAVVHTTDPGQQFDLQEQIGLTFSLWGQYDSAIESLRSIADSSANVYRLARIWYLIGDIYRLAGQEQDALAAFEQATLVDPRPGYAYTALIELVDAGVKVDEFLRGRIDYYAESYPAAVAAFYRYIESTPDYSSDAHYYVARSYLLSGSFDLAVREAERAIEQFPDSAYWGDLWLIRAQALAGQERISDAVAAYLEFADTYPDQILAVQAYWEAAWLLENESKYGDAAGLYTILADRYPNDESAPSARFRASICRYRDGDPDAAIAALSKLVTTYRGMPEALGGSYWLGKLLWQQDADQEARAILSDLASDHPRDYYGLRAAHLLDKHGQVASWPDRPVDIHFAADREAEQREAEEWLSAWAVPAETETNMGKLSPEIEQDLRFRRGMELLTLSRWNQARQEFESLRQDIGRDPVALYQFAVLMSDLGMYPPSLRAAIDIVALAPENSVLDMPRFVQKLAFPVYFSGLVVTESQEHQVDPLLMFALIRQESIFDAQVTSWAGAVGLTQIMPSTGEWIAEMMPWPDYQEDDLARAYLNTKFGVWFLSRILDMTEGNVPAALAGYNGGPANGVHWLEAAGGDPDLFVEVITRDEPQRYVREVYRHYDMYVRLYGSIQ